MFQSLRKKVNSVLPDIENIYLSNANSTQSSSKSSPTTSVRNHFGLAIPKVSSSSLSLSLSSPSPSSSSPSSSELSKVLKSQWPNSLRINFNAGCTLLEQNEKLWEDLHATNEINAKKAEECDVIIAKLNDSINKRCIDLSDINVSLDLIPNILQTLDNCSTAIMDINEKCIDVEKELFELEDLMEVLQLQEKQLDSKFEMAMFKERKLGA